MKGKLASGVGSQYSSHFPMVYPALLPLMRTPRLPVVDSTDAPADLNGLVRFADRRILVSVRVPSHFNWPLLHSSCEIPIHLRALTHQTNHVSPRKMTTADKDRQTHNILLLFDLA